MKEKKWRKLIGNVYYKKIAKGDYLYLSLSFSFPLNRDRTYNVKYMNFEEDKYSKKEIYEALKTSNSKPISPRMKGYLIMQYYQYYEWYEENLNYEECIILLEEFALDLMTA